MPRRGLAESVPAFLPTLAALGLAAWVLAYWTWIALAPRAEPRAAPLAEPVTRLESAYALFGAARRDAGAPATGVAIKLLGVAAATQGRRGYAVVMYEGSDILAVGEGERVAPGIRLAEVHSDRVILERNGARETLGFPEKTRAAEPVPKRSP